MKLKSRTKISAFGLSHNRGHQYRGTITALPAAYNFISPKASDILMNILKHDIIIRMLFVFVLFLFGFHFLSFSYSANLCRK